MKQGKHFSIFRTIITVLIVAMTFFRPFEVFADNSSQTQNGTNGTNTNVDTANYWSLWSPYSGTRYTVIISGETISWDLNAGKSIKGTNKIKGYQSSSLDNVAGESLPEGVLVLERDDWSALAKAKGRNDIAEAMKDTNVPFTGIVEQYLNAASPGGVAKHITATELKKLAENATGLDLKKLYKEATREQKKQFRFLINSIYKSYNSFTEEQPDLYAMMGFDSNKGWGGYYYNQETPPEELPPEDPLPTPLPTPIYTITPGDAPAGGNYHAEANIDDDGNRSYVNVAGGGPIPVTDGLVVNGKTNLGGAVENYGYYTVDFAKGTYSYTAHTAVTYQAPNGHDDDGNIIYEDVTLEGESYTTTKEIEGELYFYIVDEDTKVYTTKSATVRNKTLSPDVVFPVNMNMTFIKSTPQGVTSDLNTRVVRKMVPDVWFTADLGCVSDLEALRILKEKESEAREKVYRFMDEADISTFWETKSDTLSYHSPYGNGVVNYNGPIENSYYNFQQVTRIVPTSVANNSIGEGYESSCNHYLVEVPISGGTNTGATKTGYNFDANSVRVHTPIYNKMIITSSSTNQLKDTVLANGSKIVRLEDMFKVEVITKGQTAYYGNIETKDYIATNSIVCQICNNTINAYTHICTVPTNEEDNVNYSVVATIIAKNGTGMTATTDTNAPDSIGTIKKTEGIYVVGKIYDMQVRTTNDTSWKISSAQDLSQLPIGEKGDNGNKIYKYAIKLGYKAYFDFKTLGVANKAVDITPKLYYVDANGNLNNNVEFYFKTSPTTYEKLGVKDILLKMSLNSTKGEVNNADFINEKSTTIEAKGKVDFSKILSIGKLEKITLTNENALYTTGPENELRWYAEVYLPSSLVVAPIGTKLVDVSNGKGIMKNGYVIVTFADVTTKLDDGRVYLQYSKIRDYLGTILDFTNSIMFKEKAENGMFKNTINLSNGKTFSGYAETEIPVIVYDISMRANNDYETEGTH